MNASTKLFLDEFRRLLAEQTAHLDRRFADRAASVAPTAAPSAAASVTTAPTSSTAASPTPAPIPSTATLRSYFDPLVASDLEFDGAIDRDRAAVDQLERACVVGPSAEYALFRTPSVIVHPVFHHDLAPPHQATATRLHLVRPDVVPEALRVNNNRRVGGSNRGRKGGSGVGEEEQSTGTKRRGISITWEGGSYIVHTLLRLPLRYIYAAPASSRTHLPSGLTHDATLGRRSAHFWSWAELDDPSLLGPSPCLKSFPGQRPLPDGAQVRC